jgi:hypothetical protein
MLRQASFSDLEYANKKRRTRRDTFFAEMDAVVPWQELLGVVEPYYPRAGGRGRPAGRFGLDAADLLSSAMVRLVGPTDGGRALRHRELASFRGFFQRHKVQMKRELRESFEAYWSAFAQEIRAVRNDAGHPTSVDPVTSDTVHASLLVFPELARLASGLSRWVADELM